MEFLIEQGNAGRWRWRAVAGGSTVALSPVRGWETAAAAQGAAYAFIRLMRRRGFFGLKPIPVKVVDDDLHLL